jgi:hypothetical protein
LLQLVVYGDGRVVVAAGAGIPEVFGVGMNAGIIERDPPLHETFDVLNA